MSSQFPPLNLKSYRLDVYILNMLKKIVQQLFFLKLVEGLLLHLKPFSASTAVELCFDNRTSEATALKIQTTINI